MTSKIIRSISRRTLLGAAAVGIASPNFFVKNAWAAGKSLFIGTYTSIQGHVIKEKVVPKFQADFDCKVFQTENVTLGNIAILRTQKANPNYSVMMMDDLGIPIVHHHDGVVGVRLLRPENRDVAECHVLGLEDLAVEIGLEFRNDLFLDDMTLDRRVGPDEEALSGRPCVLHEKIRARNADGRRDQQCSTRYRTDDLVCHGSYPSLIRHPLHVEVRRSFPGRRRPEFP